MVTAESLQKYRETRRATNHETYKHIFQGACNKLQRAAQAGAVRCRIHVPAFVFGRPMYDVSHAVKYVHRKLLKRGFGVEPESPQILHVSWERRKRRSRSTSPPLEERQVHIPLEIEERVIPAPLPPLPETSRPPKPAPRLRNEDAADALLKELREIV